MLAGASSPPPPAEATRASVPGLGGPRWGRCCGASLCERDRTRTSPRQARQHAKAAAVAARRDDREWTRSYCCRVLGRDRHDAGPRRPLVWRGAHRPPILDCDGRAVGAHSRRVPPVRRHIFSLCSCWNMTPNSRARCPTPWPHRRFGILQEQIAASSAARCAPTPMAFTQTTAVISHSPSSPLINAASIRTLRQGIVRALSTMCSGRGRMRRVYASCSQRRSWRARTRARRAVPTRCPRRAADTGIRRHVICASRVRATVHSPRR